MEFTDIRFSRHAIERMFQRGISPDVVEAIVATGEIIASYPDDVPFPSALLLGIHDGSPVHVIAAVCSDTGRCHVVTVYHPDGAVWSDDFKTRREP